MNFRIISAGAGSGKTYRLTSEMVALLKQGVRPSGIIATTFTNKAAAELQERVRVRLLEDGLSRQADELTNALIGTVHSLGVKLLHRFAYEAGVSPQVDIIADEDQQVMFNQSLATVLTMDKVEAMERLSDRLGLNKREHYDWRREVKMLTDVARANDFSVDTLEKSKRLSFETFRQFLGEISSQPEAFFNQRLELLLRETINRLENNEDETKKTTEAVNVLKASLNELRLRDELYWHQWVKIAKLEPGAKSRDDMAELKEFAHSHDTHPAFHRDIHEFIDRIFDIAVEAIREYDTYKKNRGLIDYTDMEALIKRLLENPQVQSVLAEELDLLLVDEFQDTSPIQLDIFLKLSRFAKYSIWVGDPKQSIYGFRGADPQLMQAIILQTGGVKPEDIQEYSWRSREDLVHAANALFTKAFTQLPAEQVALKPKRTKKAGAETVNKQDEPIEVDDALAHWHFIYDGEGRPPGRPWMENCIADRVKRLLEGKIYILPKGEKEYRPARPGDVAVLCRSNQECRLMAEALHQAGLKAAISRAGLLSTAEAKLVLACLKYILNQYDSLSVAEIMLLAGHKTIEEIIEHRLDYLDKVENKTARGRWAEDDSFIRHLNQLRSQVVELSSAEILDLLLEELDLRRSIVSWGNIQQRLDNVDVLRRLALQYEEACNRLHTAASLGGFLLWLNDMENNGTDMQGSGEGPDSVNVLTYHKSKGLEWPVVVCHSLEGSLRADVWGIDIIQETEQIDLDNVLGNRWLRYWINPYSDQYRNTQVEARIQNSNAQKAKTDQALQEEARLLYVGFTRARDYLIFPSTAKPTRWLNRVWHQGQEDHPTLEPGNGESPWEWQGVWIPIRAESFSYPRDFTHAEAEEESIIYIEPPTGKKAHPPFRIDLNKETLVDEISARTGQIVQYGPALELKEDADQYQAAKTAKAFLNADVLEYGADHRLQMAGAFVERYGMTDTLDPKALVRLGDVWSDYLTRNFSVVRVFRKYPVRYFHRGRLFETIIDTILETDKGLMLIQNSGFSNGQTPRLRQKALELGPWLHLSKSALQTIFDEPRVRTMVHFVMSGGLVEVETFWED
jgi:ATP-dependent helicase/nuclease subunit A